MRISAMSSFYFCKALRLLSLASLSSVRPIAKRISVNSGKIPWDKAVSPLYFASFEYGLEIKFHMIIFLGILLARVKPQKYRRVPLYEKQAVHTNTVTYFVYIFALLLRDVLVNIGISLLFLRKLKEQLVILYKSAHLRHMKFLLSVYI
jgi:hypothetical protein